MTPLTPEERLKAYVYALERQENYSGYVCHKLNIWLFHNSGEDWSNHEKMLERHFPEFLEKKPVGAIISERWWPIFSPLRILALEYCILEVSMRIEYEKQLKGKI